MAIKVDVCENCGKAIYCVADFEWYHQSSRRWYCGLRDWLGAFIPSLGARPKSMAGEGTNA